ncbi:MAG: hypothetical protein WBD40_19775 [Tepidisphaeraceae bacterium]
MTNTGHGASFVDGGARDAVIRDAGIAIDRLMDRYVLVVVIGLLLAIGCSAPRPKRVVTNPDPSGKIPAIKEAVREHDLDASRQLVKDLDSDDPAVRFFAIGGLKRLTGETFEYRYYEDEIQRQPAIERWKRWLAEQESNGGGQQDARRSNGGASDAPGDKASEP